jgi:hypothetical protein
MCVAKALSVVRGWRVIFALPVICLDRCKAGRSLPLCRLPSLCQEGKSSPDALRRSACTNSFDSECEQFLLMGMVEDLTWERRAETTSCTRPALARPARDQNCGSEESRDTLAYPLSTIYGRLEACTRDRFRKYIEGFPGGRDYRHSIAG